MRGRGPSWPAALALAAAAALPALAQQMGEPARGQAPPLHEQVSRITGPGSLPPPGTGLVQRGQYVMTSGGGAGIGGACLSCHGVDGAGDPGGAFPRLAGQPAGYLEKSLREYADGTRQNPVMSPIAKALSAGEKTAVAAYYAAQRAPHARPPDGDPSLLQWGAVLNAIGSAERGVQACQNCHGPAGIGIPPNYPALAGQHAAYLEQQLRLWRSGERTQQTVNLMGTVAKGLTDQDIKALSLYFATLRPAQDATAAAAPR